MQAHDQYVTLRGLRFHYRVVGAPDAPPVLVLHGIMGHSPEWDVLVSALASRFRVAVGLAAFVKALGSASYDSVDQAYAEWSENPMARPELLRHYVEHCLVRGGDGRLRRCFDGIGLARFFSGVSESELWQAVDRIACPVLLVRGEHSPALSDSTAEEMMRRFRDARLALIPGAGHDLGVEQPEAVADAAIDFLSK